MESAKTVRDYHSMMTYPFEQPKRRHNNRLRAFLILASLACALAFTLQWAVSGLQNGFYAAHITGWHQVTVVPGETVYGFASASGAGYIPAVEQAIDTRNKLVDGRIYAGMTLYVPDKQAVK